MRDLFKAIFDEEICPVWGMEWAMVEGEWVLDEVTITKKGVFGAICVPADAVILLASTGLYLDGHLLFEGDMINSSTTNDSGFILWSNDSWKLCVKNEIGEIHYIPLSIILHDDYVELTGNRFLGEDAYER